jgi:hypothetical protein
MSHLLLALGIIAGEFKRRKGRLLGLLLSGVG